MLQIKEVNTEGVFLLSSEQLVKEANYLLGGMHLKTIPKRNAIFYPKKNIVKSLTELYPRIQSVYAEVSFKKPSILTLTVVERESKLVWCDQEEMCYYVDEDGTIFAEAVWVSDDHLYIKFTSPESFGIGDKLFTNTQIDPVLAARNSLKDTARVTSVLLGVDGDYELVLETGTKIIFNENDELGSALNNLNTFLGSDVVLGENETLRDALMHFSSIDLRFGKKIFFKRDEH